jgi:hypothetical protein
MRRIHAISGFVFLAVGSLLACSRTEEKPGEKASTASGVKLTTARSDEVSGAPQLAPAGARQGTGIHKVSPRRAIAGIAGFQTSSRIVYDSEPLKPHMLSATYLFPDRVRLLLSLDQGTIVDRVLYYRFGDQGFFIDQRTADSRELVGAELLELRLQTELRRALFLWPDGFSWREEGNVRTAELADIGRLVAQLDAEGLPNSMKSFDLAAAPAESLDAISWQKIGERHFPRQFDLSSGGARIAKEDVLEVETAVNYLDAYFLPPDRRTAQTPSSPPPTVEAIDLPASWVFRAELEAAARPTLETACAVADDARSSWMSLGVRVLDETILELDSGARPTAALLHAEIAGTSIPDGWSLREGCPAWSLELRRAEDADAAHIAWLVDRCSIEAGQAIAELHWTRVSKGRSPMRLVVVRR